MTQKIRIDQPVFLHDGDVAIGAVQDITPDHIEIYIENAGDFPIPHAAVKDVHFDKVVLDSTKLDKKVLAAIARAHAQEDDEDHAPADD